MWSYPYFLALSILQGMKQICNTYLDSDWKRMSQKCYQFVINEKKKSYFFTYILPNYVFHEITKEFGKNGHFENMTAGFLLRCHNSHR